jgi:hypothetical protein
MSDNLIPPALVLGLMVGVLLAGFTPPPPPGGYLDVEAISPNGRHALSTGP